MLRRSFNLVLCLLTGTTAFLVSSKYKWKHLQLPGRKVFPDLRSTTGRIKEAEGSASATPPVSFDYGKSLPESEYSQVLISVLPIAHDLRKHWDMQFQDPRQPDAKRFSWDPWYVEVGDGKFGSETSVSDSNQELVEGELGATRRQIQYSLKRTTTSSLFDNGEGGLYDRLVDDLVDLGSSIGLTAITPPWISLYTEGDMQNFHTDAPHGPLAFVLSLCQEGDFSGGETMMLQPRMLEYWRGFDGSKGIECGSIVRYVLLLRFVFVFVFVLVFVLIQSHLVEFFVWILVDSFHQHLLEDALPLIPEYLTE